MSLPLETKVMIFRSLSASLYLTILLSSFHYAFSGFLHFLVGVPMIVLSGIMVVVNLGSMFGPSASMVMNPLEQFIKSPNGETVFTFQGRLIVDGLLGLVLILLMGKWILAVCLLAVTAAVVALKDIETDLFDESFRQPTGSAAPVAATGGGDWSTGGYQSVGSQI